MKYWISAALLVALAVSFTLAAPDATRAPDRAAAEKAYAEKSFSMAHDLYARIDPSRLSVAEKRWVTFRLADTAWRAFMANPVSDTQPLEAARKSLQEIVDQTAADERDRIWAEAQESLGELGQRRPDIVNNSYEHYDQALEWWASQSELEPARGRYLSIVWRLAGDDSNGYDYYNNSIPIQVLENAVKIANTPADRTRANFLLALALSRSGGDRGHAATAFQNAIKEGKSSPYYDAALFFYGQWAQGAGRVIRTRTGQLINSPDYELAAEQFRKITTEFRKGESRYFDRAAEALKAISSPQVNIFTTSAFLPGTEVEVAMTARNMEKVDLALFKLDLMRDLKPGTHRNFPWQDWIDRSSLPLVKRWSRPVTPPERYAPVQETIAVEGKLPKGSYLLVASGEGVESRAVIFVSDIAVVSKRSPHKTVEFVCNVLTGAPVASARVRILELWSGNNGQTRVVDRTIVADGDGLAQAEPTSSGYSQVLIVVSDGASQSFDLSGSQSYDDRDEQTWHIYAFTDRPAYRPEDEVQWKTVVRTKLRGEYGTPANQLLEYEIRDPRGNKVKEGKAQLNAFGSAWDSFQLDSSLPLGQYDITFYADGRNRNIGSAQLFRLEEYKLPEFRVRVETPEEGGRRKTFVLGDTIDATISAEYYFGGPVADATVEVEVHQNPFYPYYVPDRDYPWFYDDARSRYYGQGQLVKKETLQTDASGKAHLQIDTPMTSGGLEYSIEARVTDASRREVSSTSNIRVSSQRYFAYVTPEHFLHRPGSKVEVKFKTIDANEQPLSVEGRAHVSREIWNEVWISPEGREVSGAAWRRLRESGKESPDPSRGWHLASSGYKHDEILDQGIVTDNNGDATLEFIAEREGFYRVSFTGDDGKNSRYPQNITAESNVWVSDANPTDLGYHAPGLQLILDKEQLRPGTKAPVLIITPASGRTVLFTIEGDELFETRVLRMTQPVRLEMIDIDDRFVPNAFLTATSVFEGSIAQDQKRVVVPPEKHFIKVEIEPAATLARPRQESDVAVTTRDIDGRPVSAEVALSVSDEAVEAIQTDLAADPRQFFFGERRWNRVATTSTFNNVSYRSRDEEQRRGGRENGVEGGAVGGAMGDMDAQNAAKSAVAEAITVTAAAPAVLEDKMRNAPVSRSMAKEVSVGAVSTGDTVEVRSDFRATAFWQPALITDSNGKGRAHFKYPDSTTSWKLVGRAVTTSTQVGIGSATTVTQQPLIVRLQAPRFFVVGDTATISAVINNNTAKSVTINPSLDAQGIEVRGATGAAAVTVPANGEKRVDWTVAATVPGSARLRVTGRGEESDAMERSIPIYDHGIERRLTRSGKTRGDDTIVSIDIPAARRKNGTRLVVQATPSLAVTMLDALPYLIAYPYGCTEQTMSRFLPAAIVRKTLSDLGISPEVVATRLFGGIEAPTADKTHSSGKNLEAMDGAIRQGLSRLYDFQHSDGGWGWWKEGSSDYWMSSYVLWGLSIARDGGIEVRSPVLQSAATYIEQSLVQVEDDPDKQAWMLHALSAFRKGSPDALGRKAMENLWSRRDRMRAYGRALLALSLERFGQHERAMTLVRNLQDGVKLDRTPDKSILVQGSGSGSDSVMATAHWGEDGFWWHWHDGPIESTSFALQALMEIDPTNSLVEPVMNWLIKNRRGSQWTNTRDTAIAVLSLNDYLIRSKELGSPSTFVVTVNGKEVGKVHSEGGRSIPSMTQFEVAAAAVSDGRNEIRLHRVSGTGPLYFSATATFFSLEEPIPAAGHELFVRRDYYRLVPRATLLKGFVYDRTLLRDGETVKSGERIEVVQTIETKNDYEYLLFEDLKPAGLEATELQSGGDFSAREIRESSVGKIMGQRSADARSATKRALDTTTTTGRTQWVYRELRDRKIAMFIDHLPQGTWEMRYELRAEVPGTYHALPLIGGAMYAPEIYANGDEQHVRVED
ncbi:MAG TPA: alpha-2-macroglobulin family protein [Thermoanaerobaculia bacterium]|nr:alpha-2-macroglobulin family protein [Thermoanaerobaculia bacterium]